MKDAIVNALAGETVIHSNALATVTNNCVVVRDGVRGAQSVVGIETITGLTKMTTTKPGLLVIASGLFMISAASYASKQGLEVTVPMAVLGALFVMGYVGTRRASVLFLMQNESIESAKGSFREATSVMRAVQRVRNGDFRVEVGLGPDSMPT